MVTTVFDHCYFIAHEGLLLVVKNAKKIFVLNWDCAINRV